MGSQLPTNILIPVFVFFLANPSKNKKKEKRKRKNKMIKGGNSKTSS